MSKHRNAITVARAQLASEDDLQAQLQKVGLALEKLFGKEYVFIKTIPDFDEALFKRISADQCLAGISSAARTELLKHQEQRKAGGHPIWGCRSLPADRKVWGASDLVSAYYLACQS